MRHLIAAIVIASLPCAALAQAPAPPAAPPASVPPPEARVVIPPGWDLIPDGLVQRVLILARGDAGAISTLLSNDLLGCLRAASGSRFSIGGVPQPCADQYDAAIKVMSDAQKAATNAAATAAVAAQKAAGDKEKTEALAKQPELAGQKAADEKAAAGTAASLSTGSPTGSVQATVKAADVPTASPSPRAKP